MFPHQVWLTSRRLKQIELRLLHFPSNPPTVQHGASTWFYESSCCFKETKGSHIQKPKDSKVEKEKNEYECV